MKPTEPLAVGASPDKQSGCQSARNLAVPPGIPIHTANAILQQAGLSKALRVTIAMGSMAMTAARRLAAILAADVVGYSRMMGENEAGTAKLVRERREAAAPIVAKHGGRIFKTMGDGMLIEFSSVVAAVECALALQKRMGELNCETAQGKGIVYRIGIHLGDVLIDGDDVLGDGVNIAARLEAVAEPGGVSISGAVFEHVRGKVVAEFVDLGERVLKNIDRPMRVYALRPEGAVAARIGEPQIRERRELPRFSIVVLPFANIGGDPEQEDFVDGVTDSLTTDLSRIRGAFVIARSTAFTFKGKAIDVRSVGAELNVRYVLEGSVQRRGDRLRVNVQLVDAESGSHLWAERFDKPPADFFELQDEIVARISNELGLELIQAEARRSERATTPDALDLIFRGVASAVRGPTAENMSRAYSFFERALAIDPDNVTALVWIAFVDFIVATYLYPKDRAARLASAEAAALKALSLAPDNAHAHLALGSVLGVTNRPEQAIAECKQALAINPSLATAHAVIGMFKVYVGQPEETEPCVSEALRLSPRDSAAFYWRMFVGVSKMFLGRNDDAVVWLRRSIEDNRNNPMSHFLLAMALALLGRTDEARAAAKSGLALNPQFTIARYLDVPWRLASAYTALEAQFIDALRRSGVPEG